MDTAIAMQSRMQIALIAHDNRKGDLLEWARFNRGTLAGHPIACNRSTADFVLSSPLLGEVYRRVSTGDRDAGHGDDLANTSPALVEGG